MSAGAAARPPDPSLPRRLAEIVGSEHVKALPGDRIAYATDATPLHAAMPDVVVLPGSVQEVSAILRLAGELGVAVVPRGAGTNLAAAAVPQLGGIVLAMTRMNRLLELDRDNLVAVCEPGLTTAALGEAAAAAGLLYPPDPGSRSTSTVAGNVACCAGGLRGLKYGVTRDYLRGAEAVLASGEVIRCGGKVVKDVAGYDLLRLLCGSEGTLAVLTEVTLALVPAPVASGTGVAYFRCLVDAARAVSATIAGATIPSTLELLDRTCMDAVEDFAHVGLRVDAGAMLIFGQDGDPHSVVGDLQRIAVACRDAGAIEVEVAADDAAAQRLLAARRAALPALSRLAPLTILEDVTVPRSQLAEMVGRIEAIAAAHRLMIGTFGHAGDGNLHPTCVLDPADGDAVERAHAAFGEIFAAALDLGGTITGEHGVGLAKLPYLQARLGAEQIALLRRIKAAFDPAGVLNPGKLGS